LLSSLAPILAIEIGLDAMQIVFLRCLIAFFVLTPFVFPRFFTSRTGRHLTTQNKKLLFGILGTGILTAGYMVSFFATAKLTNASISLIGFGSTSVWTTLLIPIIVKQRRLSYLQLTLGLISVFGFLLIFKITGLTFLETCLSVLTGILGAGTVVSNRYYARLKDPFLVTYIQLFSGFLVTGLVIFFLSFGPVQREYVWYVEFSDLLLLLVLSIGFSMLLYARFISLMKQVSVFLVAISSNLMPLYGMGIALILLGQNELMQPSFYLGTLLVVFPVIIYSFLRQTAIGRRIYEQCSRKLTMISHHDI
jgi:drug/metabolite transporter (DMT)-like permease